MPRLNDIKLKVCGLRDNIEEVIALHPDYAGFIFYQGSSRYVGDAGLSLKHILPSVKKIGVFVDQGIDEVADLATIHNLSYVQLHGDESVDYCQELKRNGFGVIKVFAGNRELNQKVISAFAPAIDFYLFDTRSKSRGGNGVTFEWKRLKNLKLGKPMFLSGGIDMDNINDIELLAGLNIHAIDINSRFEVSPGLKNIELIQQLKLKMKQS